MKNYEMLAALKMLPDADLMTATKLTDPLGAGIYYRANTVLRLIEEERNRCLRIVQNGCGDSFIAYGLIEAITNGNHE